MAGNFIFNFILSAGLILCLADDLVGQCPGIDFSADKTKVCKPGTVEFTATGVSSGASLTWNFGSGPQQGGNTASTVFTQSGKFTVSLEVVFADNSSCKINKPDYIEVVDQPTPVFTVNKTLLCNGFETVEIKDITPNSTKRKWIIGNTEFDNAPATLSYNPDQYGYVSVTLILKDYGDCAQAIGSRDSAFAVFQPANINIVPSVSQGCAPASVDFAPYINTPGQQVTSYSWNFTGATPSSSGNSAPKGIVYNRSGEYNVSLQIKTNNQCSYSYSNDTLVKFGDDRNLAFSVSKSQACVNEVIEVRNTGSTEGLITWEHPDADSLYIGPDMLRLKYSSHGTKSISIHRDHNGCKKSYTNKAAVNVMLPKADFVVENPNSCRTGPTIRFKSVSQLPSSGTNTYHWTFFDKDSIGILSTSTQQNPSRKYDEFGLFDVMLVVKSSNGCSDTMRQKHAVKIKNAEALFVSKPEQSCPGTEVRFINQTPDITSGIPNKYKWTFYDLDDQTVLGTSTDDHPTKIYNKLGKYDIELLTYNNQGCSSTVRLPDFISVANITASFTAPDQTPCSYEIINIQATTKPSYYNFDHTWTYRHVDSSYIVVTDTGANPQMFLPVPGKYHVTYKAETGGGMCVDSIERKNFIEVSGVVANVTIDDNSACLPFTGNLTSSIGLNIHPDNSSDNTVTYQWGTIPGPVSFGSPTASNTEVTIHQKGAYDVFLITRNSDGCVDSNFMKDRIYAGVDADFEMSDSIACPGETIQLLNTSKLRPTGYEWLSDPQNVTFHSSKFVPNPKMILTEPGINRIIFVTNKDNMCYDTLVKTVNVEAVKAAFYSLDTSNFCAPAPVKFFSTSTNADSLAWYFGDGKSTGTERDSLTHVYYQNSGKKGFTVKLVATNQHGCVDSVSRTEYIKVTGPLAYVSWDKGKGCTDLAVTFTDSSESYTGYTFDYGDGSPIDRSGNPGTHTYILTNPFKEVDHFKPKLVLVDEFGCYVTYEPEDSITVYNTPNAGFEAEPLYGCEPLEVQFRDTSRFGVSRYWDFNSDRVTDDTAANPLKQFEGGMYRVQLVAETQYGCTDTLAIKDPIEVYHSPNVSFDFERRTYDTSDAWYHFWNKSSDVVSNQWYVDDFPVENSRDFATMFSEVKSYRVGLVGESDDGCLDSFYMEVSAYPHFYLFLPDAFTPDKDGLNEEFGPVGTEELKKFEIMIFNRWGEVIFVSKDPKIKWDGNYKGEPCEPGVYAYHVQLTDHGEHHVNLTGHVMLIR